MVDLMRIFEIYLAATFLLGTVQLRNQAHLVRLVVQAPRRWPRLVALVRADAGSLLTWSTVATVGVGSGLWLSHTLARNLIWPEAAVGLGDLQARPAWMASAAVTGLLMVTLDARALVRALRYRAPRAAWLLDLAEAGLSGGPASPVGAVVGWHVRRRARANVPILRKWIWRRSLEQSARLAVGLTLWITWRSMT